MNTQVQPKWRSTATTVALLFALVGVLFTTNTTTAEAASAGCSNGRCTVYLSKAETKALGQGRVPAPPAATPAQLRTAYYALAYGHRWIAQQYGNRGRCSGFRLSIYPWESQGYFGYSC